MGDDPAIGEYGECYDGRTLPLRSADYPRFTEKLLLATKTTARKELILLHDERTVAPGSTRPWLKVSPDIQ